MRHTASLPRILIVSAAALTFGAGIAGTAAAASDTTEPADEMADHTTHAEADTPSAYVEAGEPTSPEAAAFCEAEIALEQAFMSEDPEAIGPAVEALMAAAPEDIAPAVETAIEHAEEEGPEFDAAYGEIIDYIRANCGFAQLEIAASEYAFSGLPAELPAAETMIGLTNIGEEVHEIIVLRINDDTELTVEEILELDEEEGFEHVTFAGIAFGFPGETSWGVFDLTPGHYVALCFLPEGATPEVMMELEEFGVGGPEDTIPEGAPELGPPHFVLGMVHEFDVV